MALTTDQLTMREMVERGYHCVKVEHYQWFPGIKQPRKKDFLGFADYIAWNEDETILIQTTSRGHHSTRRKKIFGKKSFLRWMKNPNHKVLIQSWDKYKGKHRYKDEYLTVDMYEEYNQIQKEKEQAELESMTDAETVAALDNITGGHYSKNK